MINYKLHLKSKSPQLLATLLFLGAFLYLAQRPGAAKVSQPLIHRGNEPLEFQAHPFNASSQGEEWTHSLKLNLSSNQIPSDFSFVIATYHKSFSLIQSELASGTCLWRLDGPQALEDNVTLTWSKLSDCQIDPNAELTLTIKVKEPGTIAAWSADLVKFNRKIDRPAVLVAADQTKPGVVNALIGSVQFPTPNPEISRFNLLSSMWAQKSADWLLWRLSLGFSLLFIAALLPIRWLYPLLWLGLAIIQATTTPPFQAPDEPDHFLAYAKLIDDPNLSKDALRLANISHFHRIKFHTDQKFTSQDIDQPLNVKRWEKHIRARKMNQRSPVTTAIWEFYHFLFGSTDVANTLWQLRIFQASLVALCVGFCMFTFSLESANLWGLMALCTTLPLFAFHVSNYFTSLALCLIPCFLMTDLLLDRKPTRLGLTAYFLCIGLMPYTSAAGISGVLLFAAITPMLLLTYWNTDNKPWAIRDRLLIAGLIAILIAPHFIFHADVTPTGSQAVLSLSNLRQFAQANLHYISLLVVAMFSVLLLPGSLLTRVRSLKNLNTQRWAFIFLITWVCTWIWTLVKPLEFLPDIEKPDVAITRLKYITKVMLFLATSLLPGRPDYYISGSFWAGFGWLEFVMSSGWIGLACLPTALGIFLYYLQSTTKRFEPTFLKFHVITLAVFLLVGFLAFERWAAKINLHGRYLLIVYMTLMSLAFAGWQIFCRSRSVHPSWDRIWPPLALLFHFVALSVILGRYF